MIAPSKATLKSRIAFMPCSLSANTTLTHLKVIAPPPSKAYTAKCTLANSLEGVVVLSVLCTDKIKHILARTGLHTTIACRHYSALVILNNTHKNFFSSNALNKHYKTPCTNSDKCKVLCTANHKSFYQVSKSRTLYTRNKKGRLAKDIKLQCI